MKNKDQYSKTSIYALISAILHTATTDIRYGRNENDALYFINSDWCKELCNDVDISYTAFRDNCLKLYRETQREKKKHKSHRSG